MPPLVFVFLSRVMSLTGCGPKLYRFLIIVFSSSFNILFNSISIISERAIGFWGGDINGFLAIPSANQS